MLNKALRVRSQDTIYAFRKFISDISKQLKSEYDRQKEQRERPGEYITVVYRGQVMSIQEFNEFRSSTNNYCTINSFLSATLNRDVAEGFLQAAPSSDTLIPVLMEIEADISQNTKPFADIAHLSQFPHEHEILFMIGSIFQIRTVQQHRGENFYTLKLVLCSENVIELQETYKSFKSEFCSSSNLAALADVLHRMSEFNSANDHHRHAVENTLLTTTVESLSSLNKIQQIRSLNSMGIIADELGDFKTALIYHEYVLNVKKQLFPDIHSVIGISYINIGNAYYNQKQFDQALSYYYNALEIFAQCCAEKHPNIAKNQNNIGVVLAAQQCFTESITYLLHGLAILEDKYPTEHPDVATCLCNLGSVYQSFEDYIWAEELQLRALDIRIQTLPTNHIDTARSFHNLGILYEIVGDAQLALYYYTEAMAIKDQCLLTNSPEYKETSQFLDGLRIRIQN
ncbi:unnamed protein product, partial [Rotaria sp. Silwood2]